MSTCGAVHPEQPGVTCIRPVGNHPLHLGVVVSADGARDVVWRNEDYTETPESQDLKGERKRLTKKISASLSEHEQARKLAREDNIAVAKQAAKVYVASGASGAHDRVLDEVARDLLANVGVALPTGYFMPPRHAKSAERRVRELRDDYGWPIQTSAVPGVGNAYLYTLTAWPEGVDRS